MSNADHDNVSENTAFADIVDNIFDTSRDIHQVSQVDSGLAITDEKVEDSDEDTQERHHEHPESERVEGKTGSVEMQKDTEKITKQYLKPSIVRSRSPSLIVDETTAEPATVTVEEAVSSNVQHYRVVMKSKDVQQSAAASAGIAQSDETQLVVENIMSPEDRNNTFSSSSELSDTISRQIIIYASCLANRCNPRAQIYAVNGFRSCLANDDERVMKRCMQYLSNSVLDCIRNYPAFLVLQKISEDEYERLASTVVQEMLDFKVP